MSTYWEDWSGSTLGNEPTGWTKRHDTTNVTWTVEEDVDGPAGRRLRVTRSAVGRSSLSFDAVDGDAARATFKLRILARVSSVPDNTSIGGTMGRGSGSGSSETLYNSQFRHASTGEANLRLIEYVSGTFNELGTSFGGGELFNFDTLYWLGLEGDGTSLRWTLAAKDTPDTFIWDQTDTDASISAAGWLGLFMAANSTMDVLAVGVGTNGDNAPLTSGASTSISVNADPLTATVLLSAGVQAGSGVTITAQPLAAATSLSASPVIGVSHAADPLIATTSLLGVGQTGTMLTILWDFDAANINPASTTIDNGTTSEPTVNFRPRTQNTSGIFRWRNFLFRLLNAQDKRPLFQLNTEDLIGGTLYSAWRPWYSYDGIAWTRWDSPWSTNVSGEAEFQLTTAFSQDTVYIGFQPGYPLSRSRDLIQWVEDNHPQYLHRLPSTGDNADWVAATVTGQTDDLSRALPAQPIRSYGIWDGTAYPDDGLPKRTVVLNSGVHSGEHVGCWMLEGAIKFLVSGDQKAAALRKNFQFLVYPNINPMGRYGGHYRGQWDPADITKDTNRDWVDQALDSTQKCIQVFTSDFAGRRVVCNFDFHGVHNNPGNYSEPAFWYASDWMNQTWRADFRALMQAYGSYVDEESTLTTSIRKWMNDQHGSEHTYTPEALEMYAAGSTTDYELVGEHLMKSLADLWTNHSAQLAFAGRYIALEFGAGQIAGIMDMTAHGSHCGEDPPENAQRGLGVSADGKWRADMSSVAVGTKFVVISDVNYVAAEADRAFASNVTTQEA